MYDYIAKLTISFFEILELHCLIVYNPDRKGQLSNLN